MNAIEVNPFSANLEVRQLPIESLQPAPYNPRLVLRPDEAAYHKLAASLREFGLVEPLIWNELSGHVVGGHARLRILKEMGATEVPVSVVRLGLEREKALNIILNNREAQGRFDAGKLTQLLEELEHLPELELTGFDEDDLAAFRLEPMPELPDEEEYDTVEITLSMNEATYDRLAQRLDELIGEFDLTSHVRKT
ncbi:MAG TPA: ParB N-terminal domain-containing protein [Gemmataceae bacterium]|nr:ParB N-terminal domain-containing protein [Gemmataceae bacterium]